MSSSDSRHSIQSSPSGGVMGDKAPVEEQEEVTALVPVNRTSPRTLRRRSVFTSSTFVPNKIYLQPSQPKTPVFYVGPVAHNNGGLTLHIEMIQIDMTIDNALWMTNYENNVTMMVNASREAAVMMHPCGRIFQHQDRVEVLAHDEKGNDKYALMRGQEVVFTSCTSPLVYQLDSTGVRFTEGGDYDCTDMSLDCATTLYYRGSRHGSSWQDHAARISREAVSFDDADGTQHWLVNGIHVSRTIAGLVVVNDYSTFRMVMSTQNASATLKSTNVRCMASVGETPHLFARHNDSRVAVEADTFVVGYESMKAAFETDDQVKLY